MSISHRKINSMIDEVISGSSFRVYDERAFAELCKKIYLIESSVDERSAKKINVEIREEIMHRASGMIKRKEL